MKTMNLQKKNSPPVGVKTKPEDVAVGLDEFIMFLGQHAGVMLYDSGVEVEAMACTRLYDLPYYVVDNKMFPPHIEEESLIILSTIVLDPENLPYEIGSDDEIFVIYDEWDFSRYNNMESAIRNIEYSIKNYPNAVIEDFVVLVGRELSRRAKRAFIKRIEYWRDIDLEI